MNNNRKLNFKYNDVNLTFYGICRDYYGYKAVAIGKTSNDVIFRIPTKYITSAIEIRSTDKISKEVFEDIVKELCTFLDDDGRVREGLIS